MPDADVKSSTDSVDGFNPSRFVDRKIGVHRNNVATVVSGDGKPALSLVYVLPAVNMAQPAFPQASPVSLLSSLPVPSMPQKNQRWYDGSVPDGHIQYVRMCVQYNMCTHVYAYLLRASMIADAM